MRGTRDRSPRASLPVLFRCVFLWGGREHSRGERVGYPACRCLAQPISRRLGTADVHRPLPLASPSPTPRFYCISRGWNDQYGMTPRSTRSNRDVAIRIRVFPFSHLTAGWPTARLSRAAFPLAGCARPRNCRGNAALNRRRGLLEGLKSR